MFHGVEPGFLSGKSRSFSVAGEAGPADGLPDEGDVAPEALPEEWSGGSFLFMERLRMTRWFDSASGGRPEIGQVSARPDTLSI
jgi:hypothetical protein